VRDSTQHTTPAATTSYQRGQFVLFRDPEMFWTGQSGHTFVCRPAEVADSFEPASSTPPDSPPAQRGGRPLPRPAPGSQPPLAARFGSADRRFGSGRPRFGSGFRRFDHALHAPSGGLL
jgi:hypothetical protein